MSKGLKIHREPGNEVQLKISILVSVVRGDKIMAKELISKLKPPKKGLAIHFETEDGVTYITDKEPGKVFSKEEAEKLGEEFEHYITFILCKPLSTSEQEINDNLEI